MLGGNADCRVGTPSPRRWSILFTTHLQPFLDENNKKKKKVPDITEGALFLFFLGLFEIREMDAILDDVCRDRQ